FLAGRQLADFDEWSDNVAAEETIPAGSIVVNARAVPAVPADLTKVARFTAGASVWQCRNRLAGVRLKEPMAASAFKNRALALDDLFIGTGGIGEIKGWWLDEVWDLVRILPEQLADDLTRKANSPQTNAAGPPTHATIIGDKRVMVAEDVVI